MAKERERLAVIGGIFILSIVILIGGILWFKGVTLGGRSTEIKVAFPSTSGLVKGDPVEVLGVVAGEVSEIVVENGRAVTRLKMHDDVHLRQGAICLLENVGIMGQKKVSIDPGAGLEVALTDSTILQGGYQPGIPELMGGMGTLMITVQELAGRLDQLLASVGPGESSTFARIIHNTDSLSTDAASVLRRSREDLVVSIAQFRRTMDNLNSGFGDRGDEVRAIIDNSARASVRLDSTLVAAQGALDRFNAFLGPPGEARDGTVAKVMRDPELYQQMLATLADVQALVNDVKEHPKRYVSISLF